MNIFRHYTNTGSAEHKKTINRKDDLDKVAIEQLLLQEFGLRVDMNMDKVDLSKSQETDIVEKVINHITPWKYQLWLMSMT